MPTRIVLTGSECTGKTSLGKRLAAHYRVEIVPEYLRSYYAQKNGILTTDDVIPIAMGQLELEQEAENRGDTPLICDTDIISSIVYARHYFKGCPQWLEEIFSKRSPSVYLLCDIDVKWVADGQRDMEHGREYMQQLFISELQNRAIEFHLVSGSPDERLHHARSIIDSLLENRI